MVLQRRPSASHAAASPLPPRRQAIVLGSLVPLGMFAAWDAAILGSTGMAIAGGAVIDPLAALRGSSNLAAPLIDAFSFLAIATSFIGFVLGLSDFLADLLQVGRAGEGRGGREEGCGAGSLASCGLVGCSWDAHQGRAS